MANAAALLVAVLFLFSSPSRAADVDPPTNLRLEASAARNAITATALDATGRPAAGAVISFQLPGEGRSGLFANGLRTEIVVASGDGRASVGGIRWDQGSTPIPVRISATKDGARAATVVEWQSADRPPPVAPESAGLTNKPNPAPTNAARTDDREPIGLAVPVYRGGSGAGKKLLLVAAIAGGAGVAILVMRSRQSPGTPAGTSIGGSSLPIALTTTTIGQPIITVGKP